MPDRHERAPAAGPRRLWWLVACVPAVAGFAGWAVLRAAGAGERRLTVAVAASRGDWPPALGVVLSLAALAVLALVAARGRRTAVDHQRQLEQQLAGTAAERRLLLSRLDHELKNPLMAMRAAVANATADEPAASSRPALASIEEQVLRLSRLTADLRKIADVEDGALDRRPVDVAALLEEAVEMVGDQPASAGRTIRLDLPQAPRPLPPVPGDMDLLSLAVVNLVDNAVKYTPPGGTIEIRAREASGRVLVEVADTGLGISADDLPHIFEELYRSAATRSVPGSGLGLPLVRAVVQRHGGSVGADSRPGEGTAVHLSLPLTAPRHEG